jgi:uncharacterized protein
MIRIDVGSGLKSKLANEEAQYIVDNIITPRFKKSEYYEGILEGLQAVIKEIK